MKVSPAKSEKFLKRMGKMRKDDLAWRLSALMWTHWKAVAYDYPSTVMAEFWELLPQDLKEFRALFCEWQSAVPSHEHLDMRMGFDLLDKYEIRLSQSELQKYWKIERLARKFLEDMQKRSVKLEIEQLNLF